MVARTIVPGAVGARSGTFGGSATMTWPYVGLDLARLRAAGWRPSPIRDFVLKVHQRCNLACDYCYVYTMADQTWHGRPMVMSAQVWRATAERIGRHARDFGLPQVRVVLHGGEPLLAGGQHLTELATGMRAAMPAGTTATICVQTNGVLLDAGMLELLRRHQISVGVSVDGTPADHDRHRRFANGAGSYAAVRDALHRLGQPEYHEIYDGLLCTVNLDADPVECYESLVAFRPPAIDLLLPHGNWDKPPRRPEGAAPDAYGRWLVAVFDRWYDAPVRETQVRLFDETMNLILGGHSRSEHIGLSPSAVAVVETDGDIGQVDSLNSAYERANATGLSVLRDEFADLFDHPGVAARQTGTAALSDACLACPVHQVCGGGHYPHRYSAPTGFRNPSVYCADLQTLIRHVYGRVSADVRRLVAGEAR
jgi:uncharacterized protein